jgi:hypothetical protein
MLENDSFCPVAIFNSTTLKADLNVREDGWRQQRYPRHHMRHSIGATGRLRALMDIGLPSG